MGKKPVAISVNTLRKNANIAGSASQKWCLLRVLAFIIGPFVPEGNDIWELLGIVEIRRMRSSPDIEACDVPSLSKWPSPYQVPVLPHDVEGLLKQEDKSVLSRRYYRKIIQSLFEDMIQYTLYPTTAQYTEVARALVTKFKILKDKSGNSTGHDTWRESLKNKFKHERAPLIHNEDVLKRKKIFGHSKKAAVKDDEERTVKYVKLDVIKESTSGEDQASISKHVTDLMDLSKKRNPDQNILNDKLERTKKYRLKYIAEHSVKDALEKFPFLQLENEIIKEVERCYGSRNIHSHLRATMSTFIDNIIQLMNYWMHTEERLLTALKKRRKKDPVSLTPCLVLHGNIFHTEDCVVMLDGIRVCRPANVAMGMAIMFCCFYIYGVEYPKAAKNSLIYFQQYIAALGRDSQTPVKVQRLIKMTSPRKRKNIVITEENFEILKSFWTRGMTGYGDEAKKKLLHQAVEETGLQEVQVKENNLHGAYQYLILYLEATLLQQ
ncbi:sterile alpha motif domain-containing protein 3-like [Anneissia japonica]|uniref:sterile alpha motif domain-containing protein 3-like n=1 Tax=Anneissia japonica TaxID=1529436 RepID=UPI001425AC2F|nr:sterile alpha motif domain-containing protein 3-like [Anneissia japonica]